MDIMRKKFEFSEEDKNIVKNAVQSLEKESSGEIVVFFAKNSDSYIESCWTGAGLLGLLSIVLFGGLSYFWMLPADIGVLDTALITIAAMIIGFIVPLAIQTIRLSFTPDATIDHRVLTKARDIFLEEQVFDTIDRTGVLIYISELEHQVQVLGDKGINEKIDQSDWNEILGLIINGIKSDQTAQGIAEAINKCKTLLLDHGFVARTDNKNELSDDIRIED